jgi:uncharacterized protein (TIRG00374 family)
MDNTGLLAPPAARRGLSWWLSRGIPVFIVLGLLYIAVRRAPLSDIWQVLLGLQAWHIAVLICLNGIIYGLVTARWWIVVRAESRAVRFFPMIGVRLSVFAVSYFTLGPQVGGEPLQILYLRRRYGLSYTRSTASVVMDKLFELLANFAMLSIGLLAMLRSGLFSDISSATSLLLLGLVTLVTWPVIHLLSLYHQKYPISASLRLLGPRVTRSKLARFARASERLAGQFCQRHPAAMLAALGVSLLAAVATVSEYVLITSFLNISLPFWNLVTAWATGWLSFLAPLPGGAGALEASQVSVLGLFGISAAAAIGVTLVMRGRDLFLGGLGLLLAGNSARQR